MHKIEIYIDRYKCVCEKDSITIIDSYKLPNNKIRLFLKKFNKILNHKILYRRTIDSWEEEWISYNILYKLGLFKSKTGNVILKENESAYKIKFYHFLSNIWKSKEVIRNDRESRRKETKKEDKN